MCYVRGFYVTLPQMAQINTDGHAGCLFKHGMHGTNRSHAVCVYLLDHGFNGLNGPCGGWHLFSHRLHGFTQMVMRCNVF